MNNNLVALKYQSHFFTTNFTYNQVNNKKMHNNKNNFYILNILFKKLFTLKPYYNNSYLYNLLLNYNI